ncbi:MAG: NTP transferase domain-containing protein [Deltaproteobacteria bacterium]|nr:NTP transferase domain-containing protein [Deltaproteobacteria bacterium]
MNGLVLAAGASRRAAGCKALFAHDATSTRLEQTIETQRAAGIERIVVMLAAPWERAIRRHLRDRSDITLVTNARPELGMLGSVRAGLASLGRVDGLLVLSLIDHPDVHASTLRALIDRASSMDARCIVRPRFGSRHGHPIVIGAGAAHDLTGADTRVTLKHALSRVGVFDSLEVADGGVLQDLDGPTPSRDQRAPDAIAFAK